MSLFASVLWRCQNVPAPVPAYFSQPLVSLKATILNRGNLHLINLPFMDSSIQCHSYLGNSIWRTLRGQILLIDVWCVWLPSLHFIAYCMGFSCCYWGCSFGHDIVFVNGHGLVHVSPSLDTELRTMARMISDISIQCSCGWTLIMCNVNSCQFSA